MKETTVREVEKPESKLLLKDEQQDKEMKLYKQSSLFNLFMEKS